MLSLCLQHNLSLAFNMHIYKKRDALDEFHNTMDVFSISSCIATSRLVHNGGPIEKLL